MKKKVLPKRTTLKPWAVTVIVAVTGLAGYLALAQSLPQPVLSVAPNGTNQFLITITNASANATYELYRTPVLNDAVYPWSLSVTGALGQSNFVVNMGAEPSGFWKASVGSDWDGDGVPNWLDANPNNAGVGALSVTIVSPANGSTID